MDESKEKLLFLLDFNFYFNIKKVMNINKKILSNKVFNIS